MNARMAQDAGALTAGSVRPQRTPHQILNLCVTCGLDFGSVSAFDAHRVGKHAYTFIEGMRMDPPREDGRRCLSLDELQERGWAEDSRGRWRAPTREPGWPEKRALKKRRNTKSGPPRA
jgi:hypothetical protein